MDCTLIGIGRWGKILKRYIDNSEYFNLVDVLDSKSDLGKMLSTENVEAVFIATPNRSHAYLTQLALNFDKHVFVEKPLGMNYINCLEIKENARIRDKVVFTDYGYNYSRSLNRIKEICDTGKLGNIEGINVDIFRNTTGDKRWILGSHAISILSMFYDINRLSVDRFYDVFNVKKLFDSGKSFDVGTFRVGFGPLERETVVEVFLSDGRLVYDPFGEYSITGENYKSREKINIGYDESNNLIFVLERFANCVKGREEDNLDMSIRIVEMLEKLK